MRFVVSILVCLGFALAPLFAAKSYAASETPKQVMLSAKIVESFIDSWKPAQALAEKYDAEWEGKKLGDSKSNGLQKLRAYLETRGALAEFNSLVRGYGFADYDAWSQVAWSVFIAHSFAEQGDKADEVDAGAAQAMQGIDSTPNLTPEQKAAMKAQVLQSMGTYDEMKPPPENVAVVKPFGPRIGELIDEK